MKPAFKIAWIFYSVLIFFIIIAAFLFPENIINNTPLCESKSLNQAECFMCGMTHAFSAIAGGDFNSAVSYNRASIPLFALFCINSLFLFISLSKKIHLKFSNRKGNKL